jgi:hypothetical protein
MNTAFVEKCYMCERGATSQEHVPPRCLFPEKKDLPEGVDLHKELIKVPSCDIHNTAKSQDDEFLLYCLCMNIANNSVAFRQFATKIMRSYNRRPGLMTTLIRENQKLIAVDNNGTAFNTLIIKPDTSRLNRCVDRIARALYLHKLRNQFDGQCRFLHDWIIQPDSKLNVLVKDGGKERSAVEHVKTYFSGLDHEGQNPSVFRYRLEEPDERGLIALSMQFYGGCNVFVAFIPAA